jgi:hypothetical protein
MTGPADRSGRRCCRTTPAIELAALAEDIPDNRCQRPAPDGSAGQLADNRPKIHTARRCGARIGCATQHAPTSEPPATPPTAPDRSFGRIHMPAVLMTWPVSPSPAMPATACTMIATIPSKDLSFLGSSEHQGHSGCAHELPEYAARLSAAGVEFQVVLHPISRVSGLPRETARSKRLNFMRPVSAAGVQMGKRNAHQLQIPS